MHTWWTSKGRDPAIIIIDDPVVEAEDLHGHAVFGGIFFFFSYLDAKTTYQATGRECKDLYTHTHIYTYFSIFMHISCEYLELMGE